MEVATLNHYTRSMLGQRTFAVALMAASVNVVTLRAQNQPPPIGVMYSCQNGSSKLKVTQCTSGPDMLCDVLLYKNTTPPEPPAKYRISRQKLINSLRSCVLPNGQPAIATAQPPVAARPATTQAAKAAFKVGDIAMAYSMFGWIQVRILEVKGDQYRLQYMDRSDMWVKASNLRRPTPIATQSGVGSLPPGDTTKSGTITKKD